MECGGIERFSAKRLTRRLHSSSLTAMKLQAVIADFSRKGWSVYSKDGKFIVWQPHCKNNDIRDWITARELYRLHGVYFNGNDAPRRLVKQDKRTNRRKENQTIKVGKFNDFDSKKPIFRDDVWNYD